jgi:hypothetical protein
MNPLPGSFFSVQHLEKKCGKNFIPGRLYPPEANGTSWDHMGSPWDADFLHCLVVSCANHSGYIYIWLYDGMKNIDI